MYRYCLTYEIIQKKRIWECLQTKLYLSWISNVIISKQSRQGYRTMEKWNKGYSRKKKKWTCDSIWKCMQAQVFRTIWNTNKLENIVRDQIWVYEANEVLENILGHIKQWFSKYDSKTSSPWKFVRKTNCQGPLKKNTNSETLR